MLYILPSWPRITTTLPTGSYAIFVTLPAGLFAYLNALMFASLRVRPEPLSWVTGLHTGPLPPAGTVPPVPAVPVPPVPPVCATVPPAPPVTPVPPVVPVPPVAAEVPPAPAVIAVVPAVLAVVPAVAIGPGVVGLLLHAEAAAITTPQPVASRRRGAFFLSDRRCIGFSSVKVRRGERCRYD